MRTNIYWVVLTLLVITLPGYLFLNVLLPFVTVFTVIGYLDRTFSSNPVTSTNLLGSAIYDLGKTIWLVAGSFAIFYFIYIGSLMSWN